MAESTLSLTFADLYREVSDKLGKGYAPTGDFLAKCKRRVNDGYRRFLSGVVPGKEPYSWSFLRVSTTMTLVAAQYYLDLPDDFASILTNPQYVTTQRIFGNLRPVGEEEIQRRRQATNNQAGVPFLFALRTKAQASASVSTRKQILFFPSPVEAYVLEYAYLSVPSKLVSDSDIPLGAQLHSDTILAAALAAAEEREDDKIGPLSQRFYERMAASIERDATTRDRGVGYIGSGDDDDNLSPYPRTISFNGQPLT